MTQKTIFWQPVTLVSLIILADQYSKVFIQWNISGAVSIIPGFFNIVFIRNSGAAWGILSGKSHLLLLISIIVLVLIFIFIKILTEGWTERYYSLALISAGIVGNSIDRLWYGSVVDFLDFYAGKYHWPAFNVADSSIFIGVAIYIISSLVREQKARDS